MIRRRLYPSLAILAALWAGLAASRAEAYVAAKVDEEIRPNFGILLHPPLYRHHHRRGVWRGRRYGWGSGYSERYGRPYGAPYGPSPYGYGAQSVTVDCGDATLGRTPISDAAQYVADGGVVYVRARGVACKETIEIDHPVVIAAEEASAFSTDPTPSPVVIQPPEGQPCVLVAQGVKEVEFRGLQFQVPRGGESSCIQGWNSEVALVRADIDYAGDGSAIYVSGGKLIVRESRIDAHTYDAAIVVEGAGLEMFKDRVRADTIGLDVTLGPEESHIDQVGILVSHGTGPGSSGLMIRGERSGGALLRVNDAVICGWRAGVTLERGARAEIKRTRICRSSFGVTSEGDDLQVTESAIGSDHIGVYVVAGNARIGNNRIYDLSDPADGVVAETGAGVNEINNWYYLKPGCDRFDWNGKRFCRPNTALPPGIRDESSFDRDYYDGWEADGYDQGYQRDGPVGSFDRPEPKKHRRGLFGSR